MAPSSDPWAESWTDEAPSGPAPTWSGERDDASGPRVEPWSPDADPWGLPTSEVTWQEAASPVLSAPDEAAPAAPAVDAPLEQIPVEPDAPAPPRVAWTPPADLAWSTADQIETDTDEPMVEDRQAPAPEAWEAQPQEQPLQEQESQEQPPQEAAWAGEPPSIFASPEAEPESASRRPWFAPAGDSAEGSEGSWRESIFPTAEPDTTEPSSADAEPAPEPPPASATAPPATGEIPEEAALEPEPEPEPQPEPEPEAPSRFNPLRWLAGRGAARTDAEDESQDVSQDDSTDVGPTDAAPSAVAEPEAEPASVAPVSDQAWEPDAALDWQPVAEPEAEAEAEALADARETSPDGGWAPAWPEADVGREPILDAAAAGPADSVAAPVAEAEPSWPEPEWRSGAAWDSAAETVDPAEDGPGPLDEPEPEPWPEPPVEPEPQPQTPWSSEPRWPEPSESTQVLPSSWTPSVPEPRPAEPSLAPSAGEIRTRLAQAEADADAEPATSTAEQAVPWLIGVILLLAGMVIVLLALIFAGDASLAGAGADPSGSQLAVVVPSGSADAVATPAQTPVASASAAPSVSTAPTPTPVPMPEYGPLEMVYQGRSAALAAIYLLHRDFTTDEEPVIEAQDARYDVRRFAWSPDGRHGAGLLGDVLVSIEPGAEKRRLGDGIETITFGADPAKLYAVRVTEDGANDVATVLAIDFGSGESTELASVSYARPSLEQEAAVNEAQFADDGGAVRLYWMHDGTLRLWALGGGQWEIDPASGEATELDTQDVPWLWDPDGRHRVSYAASQGTTTLTLLGRMGDEQATTTVEGLVSHLRWSPDGKRVVFTLGRPTSGGGVLQDLFLWDQADCQEPCQLTNTGAAFGAQWVGTMDRFQEATPDA
jgi:hypothetical protein